MRCLTLATELRSKGAEVWFISAKLPGAMDEIVSQKEYKTFWLPNPTNSEAWQQDAAETAEIIKSHCGKADFIVIDNYKIDCEWESLLRPFTSRIMVIDDLANRKHDCDILLDQNYLPNMHQRYSGLAPQECRFLLGPSFALLRPEFTDFARSKRQRDGSIREILICFGSSDFVDQTTKTMLALEDLKTRTIAVNVVVGISNPHKAKIKALCDSTPNARFHCQVENMAELMNSADLMIGAGGSSAWERCLLGLPSITIVIAPNQSEITEELAHKGATWNLGCYKRVSEKVLATAIRELTENRDVVQKMGIKARNLIGGKEYKGAEGVVSLMLEVASAEL